MSQEDKAQEVEAFQWRLHNEFRKTAPVFKPGDAGYGPEFCENTECQFDMPALRRAMGERLCTDCKSTAEIRAKRRY